ncbi:MAG: putative DNA binding domain-containing protein [Burkholderiales bacterium]|nr:putative DNA binding domain-containing protein [Opitutaceae bacterium]
MPLPVNLPALLPGDAVEWERMEFKAGWSPQDALHTLCAFANDFHNLGGGYLLLGVAEQKHYFTSGTESAPESALAGKVSSKLLIA